LKSRGFVVFGGGGAGCETTSNPERWVVLGIIWVSKLLKEWYPLKSSGSGYVLGGVTKKDATPLACQCTTN
jgi:hypothetical protein